MIWPWIIGGLIVLIALGAIWKLLARFLMAFLVAAAVLLALHFRHDPAEAGLALAGLGGVVLLRRPVLRLISLIA